MFQSKKNHSLFSFLRLAVVGAVLAIALSAVPSEGVAKSKPVKVMFIGDNFVNGYGLNDRQYGVTPMISKRLMERGGKAQKIIIDDRSRDGEVTATVVSQLPEIIKSDANLVVIALGMNDAIRQVEPDIVYNNLDAILKELTYAGKYILLVGYDAPRYLSHNYILQFGAVYSGLLKMHQVNFINSPFADLMSNPDMWQKDGLHLNAFGAENVAGKLADVIYRMSDALQDAREKQETEEYYRQRRLRQQKILNR